MKTIVKVYCLRINTDLKNQKTNSICYQSDLSKTKTLIDSDLESSYIPREIPSKYVRATLTNAES